MFSKHSTLGEQRVTHHHHVNHARWGNYRLKMNFATDEVNLGGKVSFVGWFTWKLESCSNSPRAREWLIGLNDISIYYECWAPDRKRVQPLLSRLHCRLNKHLFHTMLINRATHNVTHFVYRNYDYKLIIRGKCQAEYKLAIRFRITLECAIVCVLAIIISLTSLTLCPLISRFHNGPRFCSFLIVTSSICANPGCRGEEEMLLSA